MAKNPSNRTRRRVAKKTTLVHCEGEEDSTFLKHIRALYSKDCGTTFTIRSGKGGSQIDMVREVAKSPAGYDVRVLFTDRDRSPLEMKTARNAASSLGIKIVDFAPCLESLLLAILNNGKHPQSGSAKLCKREFERKHIPPDKRTEISSYRKLFPRELLDEVRKKSIPLNALLCFFEGKPLQISKNLK